MIFNESLRVLLELVWADEAAESMPVDGSRLRVYALERMLRDRGAARAVGLSSWREETEESLFFDDLRTPDQVEQSDELMVQAFVESLARLSAPPSAPGVGGFGTPELSAWLWGLRHAGRFESILAPFLGSEGPIGALLQQFSVTTSRMPLVEEGLEEGDPRAELTYFPRPGDQWGVDAANPGFSGDYTFGNGPVMRMVISLDEGVVRGQNIVPGGQSGSTRSEHFDDQLRLWLANDTIPMRFELEDVVEGSLRRWTIVGAE
jgi:acyl-homoserine lactone acylase PvdQ